MDPTLTLALVLSLSLLIGVSLGVLGGGGSILTVPILVYVAGMEPKEAIAASLFVVGVTSAAGAVSHARHGRVRWRTGLVFGAAGLAGAFLGGLLGGHLPGTLLLVAFALMMVATAAAMIRGRKAPDGAGPAKHDELPVLRVVLDGLVVGLVTGLVGAGGGFLVVPALALLGGLPMAVAVGTSLLVIAMKSLGGLAGYLSSVHLDWSLVLAVTGAAVVGSVLGGRLAGRIPEDALRKGFGWFVLVMGGFVLSQQAPEGWTLPLLGGMLGLGAVAVAVRTLRQRRSGPSEYTPGGMTLQHSDSTQSQQGASMYFAQHYLDCLSQASYVIGDERTGQAVVVDPRRDIETYLQDAEEHGLTIVGVINTHFHADFVSGHIELAKATGAWIGYGRAAKADFEVRSLSDGERIELGDVVLEIMETPGHTPESISVLVYETAAATTPYGVLTGDALFIGDVGRPDLLASIGVTADELGRMLYDSIQNKLMSLPDGTRVFPAHGAGSACGKNLSTETQSTIGEQRRFNYACQPMTEEQFVAVVTAGQPPAPEYFVYNAILNRKERETREPGSMLPALSPEQVTAALAAGAKVIDARDPMEFAAGHLKGAINVPVDGRMAETVGMVVKPEDTIVLMAPEGEEQEAAVRLARIGFDHAIGFVPRPEAYLIDHCLEEQVAHASRLTPNQLQEHVVHRDAQVVDIRNAGETESGMVPGAVNIPLAELARRAAELDPTKPTVLYCAGGWRSSVGSSLLRHLGFGDVSDLLGGYAGWEATQAAHA